MAWKLRDEVIEREVKPCYANTLEELILQGQDIMVCDSDLAGSSGTSKIFEKYPNNSVNFGICEANMIAAAAAMSRVGWKAYVHSFAPFVSRRVMDQVFISAAFAQQDIHIYASDPGYFSLYNGATHTTFEDIAIMRSIPNVCVVAPSDAVSFAWVLRYYAKHGGVIYNRCTRKAIPVLYEDDACFAYGKGQWLKHGKDVALIAIGASVYDALESAIELEKLGISTSVIDLFFIKPLDESMVDQVLQSHKAIVTIENHNRFGGIGEMIGSRLAQSTSSAILQCVCVEDRFGEVGTKEYLKEIFHLTKEDIIKAAVSALNKRKNM